LPNFNEGKVKIGEIEYTFEGQTTDVALKKQLKI